MPNANLTCSNRTLCNQSHICKHAKPHERSNSCNKCGIYEQLCVDVTKGSMHSTTPNYQNVQRDIYSEVSKKTGVSRQDVKKVILCCHYDADLREFLIGSVPVVGEKDEESYDPVVEHGSHEPITQTVDSERYK